MRKVKNLVSSALQTATSLLNIRTVRAWGGGGRKRERKRENKRKRKTEQEKES